MQEHVRPSANRQQGGVSLPAHTVNARRVAELIHDDGDLAVVLLIQDVAGGQGAESENACSLCQRVCRR